MSVRSSLVVTAGFLILFNGCSSGDNAVVENVKPADPRTQEAVQSSDQPAENDPLGSATDQETQPQIPTSDADEPSPVVAEDLSAKAEPPTDQQLIAEKLSTMSVFADWENGGWNIDFSYSKDPDQSLSQAEQLQPWLVVEFDDKAQDTHIIRLASHTSLREVVIQFNKNITDDALAGIGKLINLTTLDLTYCENITQGVESLAPLTKLETPKIGWGPTWFSRTDGAQELQTHACAAARPDRL